MSDTIQLLLQEHALEKVESARWFNDLYEAVSNYLQHDFNSLIQILYRMDVSEEKLRHNLNSMPGTDAAYIIATLMLERQVAKVKARKQYKPAQKPTEDEAW
ncbi:MAG: hypothetical protein MUF24_00120 [Chitinophagaceae bacterium]|jgi:hypothetical protein|nr:hypothetical protein [Chitinophagaceae bacterium]